MVDWWWGLAGTAVPTIIAFRLRGRSQEEQFRGRDSTSSCTDSFVCERVCTSKGMLQKVGSFSKDPTPDTCVTVCGMSEVDACAEACGRSVCADTHHVPNWNDMCMRRCQSECSKARSQA